MLCCPNSSSSLTLTSLGKKLVVAIKALMITQLALSCFSFVFSPYEGVIEMVFSLFLYCAYSQYNFCSCLVYIFFSIIRLFMIFVWSGLMIQNSKPFFTNDHKSNSFTILNIISSVYYLIAIILCFHSYREFKGIALDHRLRLLNASDGGHSYQSYMVDYENNHVFNPNREGSSASSHSSLSRNHLHVNFSHQRGNSNLSQTSVRVSGIADLASNDEETQRRRTEQARAANNDRTTNNFILTEEITNNITEPLSAAFVEKKSEQGNIFENNKYSPSVHEIASRRSFDVKGEKDLTDSATKKIYYLEDRNYLDTDQRPPTQDWSPNSISRSLSLK